MRMAVWLMLAALLPSVAHPDCQQATKAKLATIEASQNDRNLLCASIAIVGVQAEASFTVRDYQNLVASAQRFRGNDYNSQTLYAEHILGNFPRVEWVFECTDRVPANTAGPTSTDKLGQIERLRKLLDGGALTQQEYDREKAKILATQ